MKNKLRETEILGQIYRGFLLALSPILFFSYYPVIALGGDATMNFELSLPLIWLVLFDGVSLMLGWVAKPKISLKKVWPWLLFPGFLTLSVTWSENPVRGLLTAGVLWTVVLAVLSFAVLRKTVGWSEEFRQRFGRVFFGSSLVAAAWCWMQSILDLVGVPQGLTLMCDGCTTQMFGFPHPNGWAIEPQFMGNLLLAPTIMVAWRALGTNVRTHWKEYFVFFFLTATLFLTFSRGAIYAFLVGFGVLTIWKVAKTKSAKFLTGGVVVVLAFLFTLNAQGLMAANGPTNDTYQSGVTKVLHQLSLGLIDLRQPEAEMDARIGTEAELGTASEVDWPEKMETETGTKEEAELEAEPEAFFDGYVAASTDARVHWTKAAFQVWRSNPENVLLGVGLGGAGQALYDAGLASTPKEIVQNQYASLLLETGVSGVALAVWILVRFVRKIVKSRLALPILSLLSAYAVSLCFFAGLPNALQIYLVPPLILLMGTGEKRERGELISSSCRDRRES